MTRPRLRRVIVGINLDTNSDTTNKNTYDSASFGVAPGDVIEIGIVQTAAAANGPADFTGSTIPLTPTLVNSFAVAALRISVYRAVATAYGTGFLRINFAAGDTTSGCAWSILKALGADGSGSNGVNSVVQSNGAAGASGTTTTITLTSALENVRNSMMYFLTHVAAEAITSPGAGFTKRGDTSYGTPGTGLASADGPGLASAAPTWPTASIPRWVALELRAGAA